ncbi:MAG: hypothetical protein Q4F12_03030 [Erysipelotrichaceae bacterium]|nr:hypothetical protein [Erysipelotrichaceae bacterium]
MKNALTKIIKETLNFETIITCYIGAVGYGVGYNLPNNFNLHPIICLICCLLFGTVFDNLAKKIVSSKYYKESKSNKVCVAVIVYIGYLIAWAIVDYAIDYDLDYDFLTNVVFIVAIQVVLLIIRMIKNSKKENSSK